MHYEINFSDIDKRFQDRAAINAAIRYNKRAVKVLLQEGQHHVKMTGITESQFLFYCSFAGIQGLPAHALWRRVQGFRPPKP